MFMDIFTFLILVFVRTLVAIPLAAIIVSTRARITGRYLNRYYIINRKRDGSYELHHQPAFGYYFASKRKFHRLLFDAIEKFRQGYPDMTLIVVTLTLQSKSRYGTSTYNRGPQLTGARLMADLLIVCNLASYRKVSGRWVIVTLIRNVHRSIPMHYVLVKG